MHLRQDHVAWERRRSASGRALPTRRVRAIHPAAAWGRRLVCVIVLGWIAAEWVGFLDALAALTLIGFAVAAAGIRRPALGLLGVGMLAVLDPISRHMVMGSGGLLRWNSFNYLLVLVTLLYLPRVWRLSDPHSRLLRLLIIILALGLPLAPRWEPGIQTLLNMSTAFALVIYVQRAPRDGEMMFWLGVVMSVTGAVGGFEYYRHLSSVPDMNKNAFAMFPLAALFGACVALPFAGGMPAGSLLLASFAAVNVAWVFLSRSRGSLMIALIAMAFLLIAVRTLPRRVAYLAAGALVVLAVSGHFEELQTDAARRFTKLMDREVPLAERTSGRANLALGGWMIFLGHPLGVGTGGFQYAWAELEQPDSTVRFAAGKIVPAHSAWIMVLAENGVPGILMLVLYVGSFAVVGLRRRDPTLVWLGLFTTVVLALAFTTTEFQSKALWFMAAAATALLHQQRRAFGHAAARQWTVGTRRRPLVLPAASVSPASATAASMRGHA